MARSLTYHGAVERVTRRLRAIAVMGLASVALGLSVWHLLGPANPADVSRSSVLPPSTVPSQDIKRPHGVLHMDGLDIPSPEMRAPERAFLHTLISDGFNVRRVDQSPWDNLFSQADADRVNTNFGDLIVVAPYESDHPLWVCVKSVNDAYVPTYDFAVGGGHGMVQLTGSVSFGRVGDVLVVSQDASLWQRLMPLVASVGCPVQ